jgi:hypothetical protein
VRSHKLRVACWAASASASALEALHATLRWGRLHINLEVIIVAPKPLKILRLIKGGVAALRPQLLDVLEYQLVPDELLLILSQDTVVLLNDAKLHQEALGHLV